MIMRRYRRCMQRHQPASRPFQGRSTRIRFNAPAALSGCPPESINAHKTSTQYLG